MFEYENAEKASVEEDMTKDEVTEAMKKLKLGKAAGIEKQNQKCSNIWEIKIDEYCIE